jgi:hypothetical protein
MEPALQIEDFYGTALLRRGKDSVNRVLPGFV